MERIALTPLQPQDATRRLPFLHLDRGANHRPDELAVAIRDGFPVSPGHTLVIPVRHVGSLFETTDAERADCLALLDQAPRILEEELHPDGYNIGINDGKAAGQTVPHLHIHLIPRYHGDQPDPRGGVRRIFPERARYWRHD